jgi:hypothetical protein
VFKALGQTDESSAHPPYSPDLAPPEFHLFGYLKDKPRGRHFAEGDELKTQRA